MSGQAAGYYNNPQGYQNGAQQQYQQPLQPQYQQQPPNGGPQYAMQNPGGYNNQNGYESKPTQPPPTYGQNFTAPTDGKQTFDQTFKIQKPKFNDIWAGILVRSSYQVPSLDFR